jgi:predicted RNase H-like HicB family nuclease
MIGDGVALTSMTHPQGQRRLRRRDIRNSAIDSMEIDCVCYPVKLQRDGKSWLVTSRDFPELTTFGMTQHEALNHARGALAEAIACRINHREEIPSPSKKAKGEFLVPILPNTAKRLSIAHR